MHLAQYDLCSFAHGLILHVPSLTLLGQINLNLARPHPAGAARVKGLMRVHKERSKAEFHVGLNPKPVILFIFSLHGLRTVQLTLKPESQKC